MSKVKEFARERFERQFPNEDFLPFWEEYSELEEFAPNGNVFESGQTISDQGHFCMRMSATYHLNNAFKAMRFDMTDPNVSEDLSDGNIGTPGRIAKVYCGFDTHDDMELGSGRWSKQPRLASFPNTGNTSIPITKRIDIISNCSHHGITFSTLAREDSYAIVSYIPDKHVLGISKLQRVANWVSQRYWLQEDLTKKLYDEVKRVAETDSVYIKIFNAVHGCESFRGARSNDGAFTSEYYGGAFEDPELRKQVN